jgi:predicted metalloprotease with PDZ domain
LGRTIEDENVHAYLGANSITVSGAVRQAKSWLALIDDVQLGGIDVGSVWFRIVESREGGRAHLQLNQNYLRLFKLVLDHRKNEVRATPRESYPESARLKTQMMWGRQNGKIVMVGLLEGGAVQSAGIKMGDELLAVGGEIVETGNPKSFCAASLEARRPSEKALKLRLRREGQVFEVVLPREEALEVSLEGN